MTPDPPLVLLETLPIDKRRALNCELRLAQCGAKFAVAMFPISDPLTGIVLGVGATKLAALNDAQNTLQAALDSVDVTILKIARAS
jgi:hypothetical protein